MANAAETLNSTLNTALPGPLTRQLRTGVGPAWQPGCHGLPGPRLPGPAPAGSGVRNRARIWARQVLSCQGGPAAGQGGCVKGRGNPDILLSPGLPLCWWVVALWAGRETEGSTTSTTRRGGARGASPGRAAA